MTDEEGGGEQWAQDVRIHYDSLVSRLNFVVDLNAGDSDEASELRWQISELWDRLSGEDQADLLINGGRG